MKKKQTYMLNNECHSIALTPDTPSFSPDHGCYVLKIPRSFQYVVVQLATSQLRFILSRFLGCFYNDMYLSGMICWLES